MNDVNLLKRYGTKNELFNIRNNSTRSAYQKNCRRVILLIVILLPFYNKYHNPHTTGSYL